MLRRSLKTHFSLVTIAITTAELLVIPYNPTRANPTNTKKNSNFNSSCNSPNNNLSNNQKLVSPSKFQRNQYTNQERFSNNKKKIKLKKPSKKNTNKIIKIQNKKNPKSKKKLTLPIPLQELSVLQKSSQLIYQDCASKKNQKKGPNYHYLDCFHWMKKELDCHLDYLSQMGLPLKDNLFPKFIF